MSQPKIGKTKAVRYLGEDIEIPLNKQDVNNISGTYFPNASLVIKKGSLGFIHDNFCSPSGNNFCGLYIVEFNVRQTQNIVLRCEVEEDLLKKEEGDDPSEYEEDHGNKIN